MSLRDAGEAGLRTLSTKDRVLYGLGHFGLSVLGYMVVACVVPFYNPPAAERLHGAQPLVASATLIAAILFFSRMIDLVADPLAGYVSDRTHTRWGRRKPYMVVSAPLLALSFVLLWRPPAAHASDLNAWYAGILLTVVFVCFAGFAAPYLALLPEVAATRAERVRLAMVQGLFNLLGTAVAAVGVGLLTPQFGFARTAAALSALCLAAMWLSCLGPGEHHGYSPPNVRPELSLGQAVKQTLTNVPFLVYWGGYYLFLVSLMLLLAGMEYLGTAFLGLSAGGGGSVSAVALVGGMLLLPLSRAAADRFGPRTTFLSGLLWMALCLPLFGLLGFTDGPQSALWQARLFAALLSPAVAVLYSVPYTLVADICDADFRRTGNHREAVYFGFQGTMMKGAWGFAPLIGALIVQLFGTAGTLKLGYHMYGPVAGLLALLGFLLFLLYPRRQPCEGPAGAPGSPVEAAAGTNLAPTEKK